MRRVSRRAVSVFADDGPDDRNLLSFATASPPRLTPLPLLATSEPPILYSFIQKLLSVRGPISLSPDVFWRGACLRARFPSCRRLIFPPRRSLRFRPLVFCRFTDPSFSARFSIAPLEGKRFLRILLIHLKDSHLDPTHSPISPRDLPVGDKQVAPPPRLYPDSPASFDLPNVPIFFYSPKTRRDAQFYPIQNLVTQPQPPKVPSD